MYLPRRFLIVDMALKGWAGHQAQYVFACADAWRRISGRPATVVLDRGCMAETQEALRRRASVFPTDGNQVAQTGSSAAPGAAGTLFENLNRQ